MDYPDNLPEAEKHEIAQAFESNLTREKRIKVSDTLIDLVGQATIDSYSDRVRARLSALPKQIRFILRYESEPLVFRSVQEASSFLSKPSLKMVGQTESFLYQFTYSDGSEFEQVANSLEELRQLHEQVEVLSIHMSTILSKMN